MDDATIQKAVQTNVSLIDMKTSQPVAGAWRFHLGHHVAYYLPTLALKGDREFHVEAKPTPLLRPDRPSTYFRTGPLPRVRAVSFVSDKNAMVTAVRITFSEDVVLPAAAQAISVVDIYSGTQIGAAAPITNLGPEVVLFVPPGQSALSLLRIRVTQSVGATSGLELDGKYQGVAGSGGFEVELTPSDFPPDKTWQPSI